MNIEIDWVIVEESRRNIDWGVVDKLVESIKEIGLLNPITIDEGYKLIAGAHRLAAAKKLGWTQIPCTMINIEDLQAKLAELDENLVRNQGSVIEQGEWLAEKKRIYEELHPETKANVAGGIARQKTASDKMSLAKTATAEIPSFVADTAEKTGLSERTIERTIQIANNLDPEVKEFAKTADIPKTTALQLARKPPEEQKKIVAPIRSFVQTIPEEERPKTAQRLLSKELMPKSTVEIDSAHAIWQTYTAAVKKPAHLEMTPENIRVFYDFVLEYGQLDIYLSMMDRAILYIQQLRDFFLHPTDKAEGGIS